MPQLGAIIAVQPAKPPSAGRPGQPGARRQNARSRGTASLGPSLPAGFLAICQPLAGDLARRREVFIAEPDAFNVHALRGAARRLQAAISLFDAVLHSRDVKWLRRELKAIAGRLGRLRDLDVFLGRLGDPRQKVHPSEARQEDLFLSHSTQARLAEGAVSVAGLQSARASILVAGLEAWLFEAASELDPKYSLAEHAAPALQALHSRVREAGRHITRLNARRRHAMRSQVKMLRYSAEAIAQLDGVAVSDPYLAAVTALSHELGDLNDDEVGARLAKELCDGAGVSKWREAQAGSHPEKLAAAWAAFVAASPSWEVSARRVR